MLLGSQVSSPSPDSAHLEGTSGNLWPCPLTADSEKHSEAEQLGPGGAAGRQHSTPGLQAAPQGLEGPPPEAEPWWAPWTPHRPRQFQCLDGEEGNSRVCSFIELRGASSLLYTLEKQPKAEPCKMFTSSQTGPHGHPPMHPVHRLLPAGLGGGRVDTE